MNRYEFPWLDFKTKYRWVNSHNIFIFKNINEKIIRLDLGLQNFNNFDPKKPKKGGNFCKAYFKEPLQPDSNQIINNVIDSIYETGMSDMSQINNCYFDGTNGQLHRHWSDGPAIELDDRSTNQEMYYVGYFYDGKPHRPYIHGPAIHVEFGCGGYMYEAYYENGKRHNPYGPAIIDNDSYPKKTCEYWENGINICKTIVNTFITDDITDIVYNKIKIET